MIQELLPQAERIGALLKARGETIAIAESSTGGLVSAALLAVGGASAYFLGGAVVYTRHSRTGLLGITEEDQVGIREKVDASLRTEAGKPLEVSQASYQGAGF